MVRLKQKKKIKIPKRYKLLIVVKRVMVQAGKKMQYMTLRREVKRL